MYVNFNNAFRTVETLEVMENESLNAFFLRVNVWLLENAAFMGVCSMSADFNAEELEKIAETHGIELD